MSTSTTKLNALPNNQEITTNQKAPRNFFRIVINTFAFAFLFFISAGYESANPTIGITKTEFYTREFREIAKSEYKKSFLIELSDSSTNFLYHRLTMDFYRFRAFLPAWTLNYGTNKTYDEAKETLSNSMYKGLNPKFYALEDIRNFETELTAEISNEQKLKKRLELELTLTKSVFKYMIHISSGINSTDTSTYYKNFISSLPRLLNYALDNGNLMATIDQLQPTFYQYHHLCEALASYIDGTKIDTLSIATHSKTATKKQIAEQLVKINFLSFEKRYDSAAFAQAVMRFQMHHGLKPTGELKKRTLKHLSKTTSFRYYQIALNLDRIRKMAITDSNYIFVNIPEYQLKVIEKGQVQSAYNVMVGRTYTPTPEISSEIRTIIANPYWTVPKSITFNEILPKIQRDSNYLARNGFMIIDNQEKLVETSSIDWENAGRNNFDYWIRQELGNSNALGNVKFRFPNKFRIFIHDTQSKKLFKNDIRAYSHGCVRLQNPEKLANYLLNRYASNAEDSLNITPLIKKRIHKKLELKRAIPVHLKYLTCSADTDGNLYFYTDIYKKDEAAIKELFPESMPM